jgi:hypothetical protein
MFVLRPEGLQGKLPLLTAPQDPLPPLDSEGTNLGQGTPCGAQHDN